MDTLIPIRTAVMHTLMMNSDKVKEGMIKDINKLKELTSKFASDTIYDDIFLEISALDDTHGAFEVEDLKEVITKMIGDKQMYYEIRIKAKSLEYQIKHFISIQEGIDVCLGN